MSYNPSPPNPTRRPKLAAEFPTAVAPHPDLSSRAVAAFQGLVDALLGRAETRAHHRRRTKTSSDSGAPRGAGSLASGGGGGGGASGVLQQPGGGCGKDGWDQGEDLEERDEEATLWEREAGPAAAAAAAAFAVSGPKGFYFQRVIEVRSVLKKGKQQPRDHQHLFLKPYAAVLCTEFAKPRDIITDA